MAIKRPKLRTVFVLIFDICTVVLATLISTLITAPKCEEYIFYNYFIPSYILGLTFLQIAIYYVFEVYKINYENFNLKDIGRIAICNGIVLICNIIFVLFTGWFNILWAICYVAIALIFTLSLRFIFRLSDIKSNPSEEKDEE